MISPYLIKGGKRWGEGRYSSTLLYLGTRWRKWSTSIHRLFNPRPPEKSTLFHLHRRLVCPQSRYGRCGVEKSLFSLPRIVAIATEEPKLCSGGLGIRTINNIVKWWFLAYFPYFEVIDLLRFFDNRIENDDFKYSSLPWKCLYRTVA
jgi:hypothetical protein